MEVVFRFAGLIARINQRLSRMRVNFVPLNIAAMIGLGVFVGYAVDQFADGLSNAKSPQAVSVAQVLDQQNIRQNYLAVSGPIVPDAGFEKVSTDNGSKTVDGDWCPMLDLVNKRALLVEIPLDQAKGKAHRATVAGMLRPMPEDLQNEIVSSGGKMDGVTINSQYVLTQGQSPGDPALWGIITLAAVLVLGMFIVTFLTKYVVFRKQHQPFGQTRGDGSSVDPQQGVDLRVTGKFVLEGASAQRFLDVPSGMTMLQSGDIALYSNIDASNRFMGFTVNKRQGMWAVVFRPESLRHMEWGRIYVGFAGRPALRIRYQSSQSQKPEAAILSFATEDERAWMQSLLQKTAEAVPA